jgi:hypothetical protein
MKRTDERGSAMRRCKEALEKRPPGWVVFDEYLPADRREALAAKQKRAEERAAVKRVAAERAAAERAAAEEKQQREAERAKRAEARVDAEVAQMKQDVLMWSGTAITPGA